MTYPYFDPNYWYLAVLWLIQNPYGFQWWYCARMWSTTTVHICIMMANMVKYIHGNVRRQRARRGISRRLIHEGLPGCSSVCIRLPSTQQCAATRRLFSEALRKAESAEPRMHYHLKWIRQQTRFTVTTRILHR